MTDSDGVLVAGNKWKQVLRKAFIPLDLSGPYKHNQNPVERAIHNYKDG